MQTPKWLLFPISLLCSFTIQGAAPLSLSDTHPDSIDEAVDVLKKVLPEKVLADLQSSQRNELHRFNSSIGGEIRNSWFWGRPKTPLAQFFFKAGIHSPDNMSGAILSALWKDLHKQPRDLDQQIALYKLEEFRSKDFVQETLVIPKRFSSVELTPLKGPALSLDMQKGHVTVLAFLSADDPIATPSEVAFLNSLQKRYGNSNLRIVAFLVNHSGVDPKTLFTKNPPRFPLIAVWPRGYTRELTQFIFSPYALSVPCNILLDKAGQMVWRTGGWNESTISKTREQLDLLIKQESKERLPGSD